MPRGYEFTEDQKKEVSEALKKAKDSKAYRRLEVLNLRATGKKNAEISEITGYKKSYVSELVSKYFNKGIETVSEDKRGGNAGKLSREEEEKLLKPFLEKANAGEILVVAEIRVAYEALTGEKSAYATIYYLLHRHGFRKVMPRSRHPKKASEEEILSCKKNQ